MPLTRSPGWLALLREARRPQASAQAAAKLVLPYQRCDSASRKCCHAVSMRTLTLGRAAAMVPSTSVSIDCSFLQPARRLLVSCARPLCTRAAHAPTQCAVAQGAERVHGARGVDGDVVAVREPRSWVEAARHAEQRPDAPRLRHQRGCDGRRQRGRRIRGSWRRSWLERQRQRRCQLARAVRRIAAAQQAPAASGRHGKALQRGQQAEHTQLRDGHVRGAHHACQRVQIQRGCGDAITSVPLWHSRQRVLLADAPRRRLRPALAVQQRRGAALGRQRRAARLRPPLAGCDADAVQPRVRERAAARGAAPRAAAVRGVVVFHHDGVRTQRAARVQNPRARQQARGAAARHAGRARQRREHVRCGALRAAAVEALEAAQQVAPQPRAVQHVAAVVVDAQHLARRHGRHGDVLQHARLEEAHGVGGPAAGVRKLGGALEQDAQRAARLVPRAMRVEREHRRHARQRRRGHAARHLRALRAPGSQARRQHKHVICAPHQLVAAQPRARVSPLRQQPSGRGGSGTRLTRSVSAGVLGHCAGSPPSNSCSTRCCTAASARQKASMCRTSSGATVNRLRSSCSSSNACAGARVCVSRRCVGSRGRVPRPGRTHSEALSRHTERQLRDQQRRLGHHARAGIELDARTQRAPIAGVLKHLH